MIEVDPNIKLGINSCVHEGCFIKGEVEIGNDVEISYNTVIISYTHSFKLGTSIFNQGTYHKPIKIGNDILIGANVTILGGTVIEDGAVIGAGAVVVEDSHIEKNEIWAGVPAKFLKMRS